jgi:hypothetical protein
VSSPNVPPSLPAPASFAQGNAGSIESAAAAAAAAAPDNVAAADAQTAFGDRAAELISGGMSPEAAVSAAAKAVTQLSDASTRSGPATPAQSLGDALASGSAPGGAPGGGSPALAAALAQGKSPAQAIATAAAAARQQQTMLAAASVPTGPAATTATGMANGALPASVPNAGAFAAALVSGLSPEAALARSATAAQTLAAMQQRANLADTPERQAASSLAGGDLAAVTSDSAGQAALAAILARGGSPQEALAAALKAQATRDDQERRGTVAVSSKDARSASLAQGIAPDDANDAEKQRQVQFASVQPNPGASALAEGNVPTGDADPNVTARLLQGASYPDALVKTLSAWTSAAQQQEQAAATPPGDRKATLIARLSRGNATAEDIAEIIRLARTDTLAGIANWLLNPGPDTATTPEADRRPPSGVGG